MGTLIKTLDSTPLDEIAEAFNAAFCDYFIDVNLNPDELAYKILAEDIELSVSPGAWVDGKLTGLVLNGSRILLGKRTAYNAGTGVRPEFRRKGMTRAMHEFMIPRLGEAGFERSVLEVIDINVAAQRAYEQIGYVKKRYLESWVGAPTIGEMLDEYSFCEFQTIEDILPFSSWWDYEPTWQHHHATARLSWERQCALGIQKAGKCIGYGLFSPLSGRVLQFAVAPDMRRNGAGKALLQEMSRRSNGPLRIINVEQIAEGPGDFLYKAGLKKLLNQWEMELKI